MCLGLSDFVLTVARRLWRRNITSFLIVLSILLFAFGGLFFFATVLCWPSFLIVLNALLHNFCRGLTFVVFIFWLADLGFLWTSVGSLIPPLGHSSFLGLRLGLCLLGRFIFPLMDPCLFGTYFVYLLSLLWVVKGSRSLPSQPLSL